MTDTITSMRDRIRADILDIMGILKHNPQILPLSIFRTEILLTMCVQKLQDLRAQEEREADGARG